MQDHGFVCLSFSISGLSACAKEKAVKRPAAWAISNFDFLNLSQILIQFPPQLTIAWSLENAPQNLRLQCFVPSFERIWPGREQKVQKCQSQRRPRRKVQEIFGASGGGIFGGSDCNPRYHEDDEVNSEEGRLKKKTHIFRGRIRRYMQQCMRLSEKKRLQNTRHTKIPVFIVIEYDSILTGSSISSHTLKCVKSNMFRANVPLCTSSLCWFNPARVRISQVTQISSASIFASFALFHPLNGEIDV